MFGLLVFGWDLPAEPHFVDESAYISQSFYADLLLAGNRDHPAWLEYGGYDLPPLPKYLIGLSLRAGGFPRPGPEAMRAWYANTSRRFVTIEALAAARRPSVVFGAIGCLAIFGVGTMGFGRRVGYLSALLLMANPLYRMHARRAMSDVPAEALILATAAAGLWGWKRFLAIRPGRARGRDDLLASGAYLVSGVLCGLATLAKLNGALGGFILAGWAALAIPLRGFSVRSRSLIVLLTASAAVPAVGTFLWFNPFLTADPAAPTGPRAATISRLGVGDRFRLIAGHRAGVSINAMSIFPNDALKTPIDKVKAVAVQGFGRFGPLGPRGWTDSTIRFETRQDWGAWAWLPCVALGFVLALARGRAQLRAGEPPAAWAIATQATVALATVTAFIPLAWDRYYLSIQPGSALLGSVALIGTFDLARRHLSERRAS